YNVKVGPSSPSAFSLDFYRDYFDVDTHQVIQRLLCGLIPFSKKYSLTASLRPMPDIYGPFWITATLIFSIIFADKFSTIYLLDCNHCDCSVLSLIPLFITFLVTVSAAILFFYWVLLPFGSILSELLAIYGYSLAIYIPAVVSIVIKMQNINQFSTKSHCFGILSCTFCTCHATFG
ncbi:unnamed protein product, partial [Mesocestoides corti]